jgi:hypothetical protein
VVVEGVALERQQHEVTPTRVLGGLYAEDDGHQGPDVLDADRGSLKRASCGGRLPWCRHWCWCWSGSRVRWRCSGSEDVSELKLKGGRGSSSLLGLDLGGGDARLKGCEGSGEVGRSGGGDRGCHGSLLLLRHDLDDGSTLTGGGGHGLDDGDGCGQDERSDVRGD